MAAKWWPEPGNGGQQPGTRDSAFVRRLAQHCSRSRPQRRPPPLRHRLLAAAPPPPRAPCSRSRRCPGDHRRQDDDTLAELLTFGLKRVVTDSCSIVNGREALMRSGAGDERSNSLGCWMSICRRSTATRYSIALQQECPGKYRVAHDRHGSEAEQLRGLSGRVDYMVKPMSPRRARKSGAGSVDDRPSVPDRGGNRASGAAWRAHRVGSS
jgi:hypothetical protein